MKSAPVALRAFLKLYLTSWAILLILTAGIILGAAWMHIADTAAALSAIAQFRAGG